MTVTTTTMMMTISKVRFVEKKHVHGMPLSLTVATSSFQQS